MGTSNLRLTMEICPRQRAIPRPLCPSRHTLIAPASDLAVPSSDKLQCRISIRVRPRTRTVVHSPRSQDTMTTIRATPRNRIRQRARGETRVRLSSPLLCRVHEACRWPTMDLFLLLARRESDEYPDSRRDDRLLSSRLRIDTHARQRMHPLRRLIRRSTGIYHPALHLLDRMATCKRGYTSFDCHSSHSTFLDLSYL